MKPGSTTLSLMAQLVTGVLLACLVLMAAAGALCL
jgi:hypothetical protein